MRRIAMPKHEDEMALKEKLVVLLDQWGLRPVDAAFLGGFVLASVICIAALGPWS